MTGHCQCGQDVKLVRGAFQPERWLALDPEPDPDNGTVLVIEGGSKALVLGGELKALARATAAAQGFDLWVIHDCEALRREQEGDVPHE